MSVDEGRRSLVTPLFVYASTPLRLRSETGCSLIRQIFPLNQHLIHLILHLIIFIGKLAEFIRSFGGIFELGAECG